MIWIEEYSSTACYGWVSPKVRIFLNALILDGRYFLPAGAVIINNNRTEGS